MLVSSTPAFAASSGTVAVKVTINKVLSVAITGGPLAFGALDVNTTTVSAASASVKNDGSGVDETLKVSVANPAGWTQGTPAKEVYRVMVMFKDTKPTATDAGWKLPAAIAETLVHDATKKLWVKLETPTSTKVATEQIIQLTISAE